MGFADPALASPKKIADRSGQAFQFVRETRPVQFNLKAQAFTCNTPTPQCDLPCEVCWNSPAALNSRHGFYLFPFRIWRCHSRAGFLCRWVAVHAAFAGRDGDFNPSAGRTSLSPAIASTPFAQTSDRRAPSPRVGARRLTVDAHPAPEGMPRGSRCSRAYAH